LDEGDGLANFLVANDERLRTEIEGLLGLDELNEFVGEVDVGALE
jgi:hypothetical protein